MMTTTFHYFIFFLDVRFWLDFLRFNDWSSLLLFLQPRLWIWGSDHGAAHRTSLCLRGALFLHLHRRSVVRQQLRRFVPSAAVWFLVLQRGSGLLWRGVGEGCRAAGEVHRNQGDPAEGPQTVSPGLWGVWDWSF